MWGGAIGRSGRQQGVVACCFLSWYGCCCSASRDSSFPIRIDSCGLGLVTRPAPARAGPSGGSPKGWHSFAIVVPQGVRQQTLGLNRRLNQLGNQSRCESRTTRMDDEPLSLLEGDRSRKDSPSRCYVRGQV